MIVNKGHTQPQNVLCIVLRLGQVHRHSDYKDSIGHRGDVRRSAVVDRSTRVSPPASPPPRARRSCSPGATSTDLPARLPMPINLLIRYCEWGRRDALIKRLWTPQTTSDGLRTPANHLHCIGACTVRRSFRCV